ncbi:MAG: GNAT family N-acetyltransferase [Polyangiales bacterium]
MSITVKEHAPGSDVSDFLRAADVVFAGDPQWIRPLDFDIKQRLDPKKNPFFKRAEAMYFTAWRDGKLVGRCSASIDPEYLKLYQNDTGFFGFFDTVDDDAVGKALIERAAEWLRGKKMKRMSGPFSLYPNEEVGVLVEGFDTPPNLMMAHSRQWQGRVAEAAGLAKEKDVYAWRYDVADPPKRVLRAIENLKTDAPEIKLRSVNKSKLEAELKVILDIYNDAWEGKWAFVPAVPDEVAKMAEDLSLVIDEDLAFIAELDGRPVAMCILLPNLNECIADLDGALFPFGWAKLLWRLKVQRPKSARLMLLGIRKELRNVRKYMPLSVAMYGEVLARGRAKGYQWGELSWTREDDSPINSGIANMGAKIYKRYRVYERAL